MPKLTKKVVDATACDPNRRVTVWDTDIRGFGLVVLKSGVKSYIFNYRNKHGQERRITIGRHGIWTAEDARTRATKLRNQVERKIDPLAEQQADRQALTINEMLDAYLASAKFADKAASTQTIDRGRIERHLRPLLGKTVVENLRTEDVRRAHIKIRDGGTAATQKTKPRGKAIVKGGETTARDTIYLLRAILNWAMAEKLVRLTENPAAPLKLGTSATRETFLDDPEQYHRLFETMQRMEDEARLRPEAGDAIRVIALTGARPGEIANARWSYFDDRAGTLTIPPAHHKTGKATGKPRVISLPKVAYDIITRQRRREPDDLVFAPARGLGPIELKIAWRRIRKEAGLPEDLGLHGLRHSVASLMALSGAQAPEIMAQMGHKNLSTVQRYIHFAARARSMLAERAAAPAAAALEQATRKKVE